MWNETFASLVLREFAMARRKIVSDWRIWIVARKLAIADNAPLPDEDKAQAIRIKLQKRGELKSLAGINGVYEVDVPYANLLEISEEQVIQEANPWATFGHLTAMAYHGVTDLVPKQIFAFGNKLVSSSNRLPLGTSPEDWVNLNYPVARQPTQVRTIPISWTQSNHESEFGVIVGHSFGVPIYITDLERTLIDALRSPEKSGGIAKVLQAWRSAGEADVEKLVTYTENYHNKVLRQRVGFLLGQLRQTHPRLEDWRRDLQRGGSVKLVSGTPYSPTYSSEWNLSLNVPPSVLAILEGD